MMSFYLLAAVHIVAHLFNFEFFMDAQLNRNSSLLPFILSEIGTGDNASFLNPIRSNETVSSCSSLVSVCCRQIKRGSRVCFALEGSCVNSVKFSLPNCKTSYHRFLLSPSDILSFDKTSSFQPHFLAQTTKL